MSFLQFLLNNMDVTDSELVRDVEQIEAEQFWSEISDNQLVHDVTILEQEYEQFQAEMSDLQCVEAVINAEEEQFNQFDMSNSQLLSEVTRIENDLFGSRLPLGRYQGPAVPVPLLRNNVVVLPGMEEKPTFDLGFCWDSDSDEDAVCSSSVDFKVPQVPVKKLKKVTKAKPV